MHDIPFAIVSAKLGYNIEETFRQMATIIKDEMES